MHTVGDMALSLFTKEWARTLYGARKGRSNTECDFEVQGIERYAGPLGLRLAIDESAPCRLVVEHLNYQETPEEASWRLAETAVRTRRWALTQSVVCPRFAVQLEGISLSEREYARWCWLFPYAGYKLLKRGFGINSPEQLVQVLPLSDGSVFLEQIRQLQGRTPGTLPDSRNIGLRLGRTPAKILFRLLGYGGSVLAETTLVGVVRTLPGGRAAVAWRHGRPLIVLDADTADPWTLGEAYEHLEVDHGRPLRWFSLARRQSVTVPGAGVDTPIGGVGVASLRRGGFRVEDLFEEYPILEAHVRAFHQWMASRLQSGTAVDVPGIGPVVILGNALDIRVASQRLHGPHHP